MLITDNEFVKLSDYIRDNFGVNLTAKKKTLVISRLNKVLDEKSFNNFTDYYNYVLKDKTGEAVTQLIDHITTNHTFFYREKQHYDYLISDVLPYLIDKKQESRDLRIWSAGCSSGEEPYTLAMVISDFLGDKGFLWDTKILATDISTSVLSKAKNAEYSSENISNIPMLWRMNYFNKNSNAKYSLRDSIKKEVIFRRLNLMSPFSFKKKFDVIFCRNVMIYFDANTTQKLVNKFYEVTEPGGYLFISHSESLDRNCTGYQYIRPSIYRKE